MMHVHVELHHLIDVERFDSAAGGHADGVAYEIQGMMVFQKFRIFRKYRTLVRRVAILFERHQTFFACAAEELEHHLQCLKISVFGKFCAAERASNAANNRFQDVHRIGDQDGSDGRAANNDQLGRLYQHFQIAVFHQIAGDDCAEDHHNADDYKHFA